MESFSSLKSTLETGTGTSKAVQGPSYSFSGHKVEGYALDWSPMTEGRLASGDCNNKIYLWEPNPNGTWNISSNCFQGHQGSVEDIQWSPTEANVMASCSADQTIKIWDTRAYNKPALSVKAHERDINVISWNKKVSYLMISGCDDGSFKIWDLRNFKQDTPAAHFKWHTDPVCTVEWHPTEESVLAIGSSSQITIWDLSLEKDAEAENETGQKENPEFVVPPQLLFVHQGQKNIKELHWHPQIPGVLVSTGESGFNVFKTFNV